MKQIYIYLPDDGEEHSRGARAELSDGPNGNVVACVSSPVIDELWADFRKRLSSHSIKSDWASGLIAELDITLSADKRIPFKYLRKLDDTQWACTERCRIDEDAARESMR